MVDVPVILVSEAGAYWDAQVMAADMDVVIVSLLTRTDDSNLGEVTDVLPISNVERFIPRVTA